MREKTVEKYLVDGVQNLGGMCMKFVSPGLNGVPDRIAIFPGGYVIFIELKAPGEKPTKQQVYRMGQLKALNAKVITLDTKRGVDRFLEEARHWILNRMIIKDSALKKL